MNYQELLNKNVVSIFEGCFLGQVNNLIFNKVGKIEFLIIKNDETKSCIKICDVFAINDCIVIKNQTKLIISQNENSQNFLNKSCITILGKDLGKIVDIVLNEKFYITKFITEKSEFSLKNIIKIGDVVVIDENLTKKRNHFAPKTKIKTQNQIEQKVMVATKLPIKVTSKSILIGRKLFRDFVSRDGITLARKNSIITSNLLSLAKEHNSLFDLFGCVI